MAAIVALGEGPHETSTLMALLGGSLVGAGMTAPAAHHSFNDEYERERPVTIEGREGFAGPAFDTQSPPQ